MVDGEGHQKLKGVPIKLRHEEFRQCVFDKKRTEKDFKAIRSYNNHLNTVKCNKYALTPFDPSRHLIPGTVNTLALGHYRIRDEVKQYPDSKLLDDVKLIKDKFFDMDSIKAEKVIDKSEPTIYEPKESKKYAAKVEIKKKITLKELNEFKYQIIHICCEGDSNLNEEDNNPIESLELIISRYDTSDLKFNPSKLTRKEFNYLFEKSYFNYEISKSANPKEEFEKWIKKYFTIEDDEDVVVEDKKVEGIVDEDLKDYEIIDNPIKNEAVDDINSMFENLFKQQEEEFEKNKKLLKEKNLSEKKIEEDDIINDSLKWIDDLLSS